MDGTIIRFGFKLGDSGRIMAKMGPRKNTSRMYREEKGGGVNALQNLAEASRAAGEGERLRTGHEKARDRRP